ncbi:polysaccharide biosynthesis/export family protein [uncultured Bacteroides sp.]|uniref:polysaccharide biosynthesis/export family protein n=1 Tax=uncultured Bacteroides sp. TaxID=162156 RepID=UPI002AA6903F|nr:polysaccharide biosynthesis/export family protein [uncultured Bacteroides sp.]
MKKTKLILLLLPFWLAACTSYKNVPYLQNDSIVNKVVQVPTLYDARIQPKDLLTIAVSTSQPELAVPFNLTVPTTITTAQQYLTSQPSLQSYLVDNKGYVDFPIVGALHLGGLTKGEAEMLIKGRLKQYLKEEPIVNVRLINYKISVIGEVARPNTFTVANEKVNVFEALALAGDLTIYGLRNNVKLIREDENGAKQIVTLNLNDANLVLSPYYYLQQNDILYVTPNKAKSRTADITTSTTIWISVSTALVSIASLLVNILK